jgi:hypothetical protein
MVLTLPKGVAEIIGGMTLLFSEWTGLSIAL